jgi:hypothetical protein
MKALTSIACAAIALIAVPAAAAPKRPPPPPPVLTPFSATAAFGETVEILTHGPLTLRLECITAAVAGVPSDIARLSVVSAEDDTLVTGERSVLHLVGDAITLIYGSVPSPDGGGYVSMDPRETGFYDGGVSGGSAITPSGFVLTVPADGVGFGIATHRFSITPHGWETAPDCFVVGLAHLGRVDVHP